MKKIYLLISLLATTIIIFACGGGGGGGDSTSISYTGLKTPAVITSVNSVELAEGIFGHDILDDLETFGVVTEDNATTTSLPHNLILFQVLANAAQQINFSDGIYLPGTIQTNTETEQCDSGTITTTVAVDDVTGEFTGSMSFNDCVILGVYMDGKINVVGTIDLNTFEIPQITMTFTNLIERYETESYTYSGQIIMTESASTIEQIIDYLVRDNNTGDVYWYENYRIALTDNISEAAMTINGRFYHPDNGYVDVITSNTIYMDYEADWPYAGIILARGDSSALMINCEGNSILTYTLGVDADDDGIYETVTIENW